MLHIVVLIKKGSCGGRVQHNNFVFRLRLSQKNGAYRITTQHSSALIDNMHKTKRKTDQTVPDTMIHIEFIFLLFT